MEKVSGRHFDSDDDVITSDDQFQEVQDAEKRHLCAPNPLDKVWKWRRKYDEKYIGKVFWKWLLLTLGHKHISHPLVRFVEHNTLSVHAC